MKKISILFFGFLIMLTGCGKTETLSCDFRNDVDTGTTKIRYSIEHEGDNVKKLRIMYDYMINDTNNDMNANNGTNTDNDNNTGIDTHTDGVGTGTDGTTNDDINDNDDGIIDGIVGDTIDSIVGGVTDTILDIAGLKEKHSIVLNTYGNVPGFSVQNTTDTDNSYVVNYIIDYDKITDDDLRRFSLSRDLNTLRNSFVDQGFTCK